MTERVVAVARADAADRALPTGDSQAPGEMRAPGWTPTTSTPAGPGQVIPESLRGPMEIGFGADLTRIRIHPEQQRAVRLNAVAFTIGNHVSLAPGAWEPTRPDGIRLLAHEVAHSLQQRRGGPPIAPVPGNAAERAADADADRVLGGGPAGEPVGTSVGLARQPVPPEAASIDAEIELVLAWLAENPADSPERDAAIAQLDMLEDARAESLAGGPETPGAAGAPPSPGVLGTIGGALLGEFEHDATVPMIVIDTVISFIPVVDQVADVRDIVAHLYWMAEGGEYTQALRWIGLTFSLVGAIPEVGTAIKGVSKLVIKGAREALEHLDEIVGLTRKLLPDGGDLRRFLAWLHENWAAWTATGRALWTRILESVRNRIQQVPTFLVSAKERWLTAIAEIERRSGEALTKAYEDALMAFDDGMRRLMQAMGVDPDALLDVAGPRPALAGAGSVSPPSAPHAVQMSGSSPPGGGPSSPKGAGTVAAAQPVSVGTALPAGVRSSPHRKRALAIIDALPAEDRAAVVDALRKMSPEEAGELLTALGKTDNPALLGELISMQRRDVAEAAEEAALGAAPPERFPDLREELQAEATEAVEATQGVGREVSKPPGPVNLEPGIKGDIGEARHQAELVTGEVKKMSKILSPEVLQDAMEALLSGKLTLSDFVARLPKEGASQFKLPTADGAHRIIDHVLLQGTNVVFRESKNYEDIFKLTDETMKQLKRDLDFLRTFKDLRIEWRISTKTLDDATRKEFDALVQDFPRLFSYVLD